MYIHIPYFADLKQIFRKLQYSTQVKKECLKDKDPPYTRKPLLTAEPALLMKHSNRGRNIKQLLTFINILAYKSRITETCQ